MKTAISVPDELFQQAETFAERHSLSRSELYAQALREHLRRQPQVETLDIAFFETLIGELETSPLLQIDEALRLNLEL